MTPLKLLQGVCNTFHKMGSIDGEIMLKIKVWGGRIWDKHAWEFRCAVALHIAQIATDHTHAQFPTKKQTYTTSMRRQPCVFNIPSSSSACLWAQGPRAFYENWDFHGHNNL